MPPILKPGRFVPDTSVSRLIDGEIRSFSTHSLFNNGRYVLVGMPGSFTPVCTTDHVPTLFDHADRITAMNITHIYCISADNPWSMDHWAGQFPSHDSITFLADGNGSFLKQSGLSNNQHEIFVGNGYGRFVAIIQDRILIHLAKEDTVLDIGHTEGKKIVEYLENASFT